jgi:hypothetical protein
MSRQPPRVQAVSDAIAQYEAWQDGTERNEQEGPMRLLAVVEAVRGLCLQDGGADEDAVRALREATGLDFRTQGDAVLFELADDKNPGRTQTIAVRAATAELDAGRTGGAP